MVPTTNASFLLVSMHPKWLQPSQCNAEWPPSPTRSSLCLLNEHIPAGVMCQASCVCPDPVKSKPILHSQEPLGAPEEKFY